MAERTRENNARPDNARRADAALRPARVLVVEGPGHAHDDIAGALRARGVECSCAASAADALRVIERERFDAAVIRDLLPDGRGLDLARDLLNRPGATLAALLVSDAPRLDDAVDALRIGAVDMLATPAEPDELGARVLRAVALSRDNRARTEEVRRLRRACRRLHEARQQVTRQIDSLCNDLADAYQELADQMTHVTLASEFSSLVRNELDVENLLRTSLEYMLRKTGPTNAAVFLPSNHADFSLGAYVNYNFPRDTVDVLLDHLADVLAPRFQDEPDVLRFDDEAALAARLGDDAHWLVDSHVIVFSCRHEGECLAVVALFRDKATAFPAELDAQLRVMGDIFAAQLARVIRIHHRHKPENAWPGFEEDDGPDELAA